MSQKKLARHVTVAGATYGPGDDVPADVMKQITNPKAFISIEDENADGGTDDDGREAGTTSGHKLATAVTIGGVTYGPKDPIPDDVAAKITNPKAWEGGELPTRAKAAEPGKTDSGKAQAAPEGSASGAAGQGTAPAKKAAPAAGDKRA